MEKSNYKWLSALAPLLGVVSYDAIALCQSDPPPLPNITAADFVAMAFPSDVASHLAAAKKFNDLITNLVWYQVCKCNDGLPPTANSPQADPGTIPTLPTLVSNVGSNGVCYQLDSGFILPTGNGVTNPAAAVVGTDTNSGSSTNSAPLPAGLTSVDVTVTRQASGTNAQFMTATVNFYADNTGSAALGGGGSVTVLTTGAQEITHNITVPTGAKFWKIPLSSSGTSTSDFGRVQLAGYCGNSPTTVTTQPGCCSDPTTLAMLNRIDMLLQQIAAGAPVQVNSYAESTVHAGLTGQGSIPVTATVLAVKVAITTDNPNLRTRGGTPTYLMDRGFIVPEGVEGAFRQQARFVYNPQIFILPKLTTTVGYSFGVGVTASITELVRGP